MATVSDKQIPAEIIPPLASGDRLTRTEFELRYANMPNVNAELVEGVVYMQSAVRAEQHGSPHFLLITWLGMYQSETPGVSGADNATLRLDNKNVPQPDVILRINSECGGCSSIDDDGYLTGPPELVVEIAASSASYDLHDKLNAYRRNGIQEYIVWRVLDEAIDWFVLREGSYEPLPADESGLIKSEAFPGLWLETAALLRKDLRATITSLQQGLTTDAHAAFCERLNSADGKNA